MEASRSSVPFASATSAPEAHSHTWRCGRTEVALQVLVGISYKSTSSPCSLPILYRLCDNLGLLSRMVRVTELHPRAVHDTPPTQPHDIPYLRPLLCPRAFRRSAEDLRSIAGVFEEVSRGHVDYGLVPIENSTIGAVGETVDALLRFCRDVVPCAEVQLSVALALIAAPGAVPSDVTTIHSKPEALAQCRRWLSTQYPDALLEPAASTSAAVVSVADRVSRGASDARQHAAIGSVLAASLSDLPVMFGDVQDVHPNTTRFLVLCHRGTPAAEPTPTGEDKTSLYFVCEDRPGALRDALDAFAKRGVNLSQVEKRVCPQDLLAQLVAVATGAGSPGGPAAAAAGGEAVLPAPAARRASGTGGGGRVTPTASSSSGAPPLAPALLVPSASGGRGAAASSFVYVFLVECDGHRTSPQIAAAVADAAAHCLCLHVIGSFPRARRVL